MNSQELSWLKQYKVKMIILDNKGMDYKADSKAIL